MGTVSLERIHEDLVTLQRDVQFIKHIVSEEFELSSAAKKELEEARKTPRAEFVKQEDVEKEFLR